jgi:alkyldihydroxyacetonephosphate synthase
MRRWNGWGDEATRYPLPSVPPPRLATHHPLILTDSAERLRHARGQSLPDWVALRSGRIGAFPDGVAFPASDEDVRSLLDFARQTGTRLIPYGGARRHSRPGAPQPARSLG